MSYCLHFDIIFGRAHALQCQHLPAGEVLDHKHVPEAAWHWEIEREEHISTIRMEAQRAGKERLTRTLAQVLPNLDSHSVKGNLSAEQLGD
jgi:hypothetical protein